MGLVYVPQRGVLLGRQRLCEGFLFRGSTFFMPHRLLVAYVLLRELAPAGFVHDARGHGGRHDGRLRARDIGPGAMAVDMAAGCSQHRAQYKLFATPDAAL